MYQTLFMTVYMDIMNTAVLRVDDNILPWLNEETEAQWYWWDLDSVWKSPKSAFSTTVLSCLLEMGRLDGWKQKGKSLLAKDELFLSFGVKEMEHQKSVLAVTWCKQSSYFVCTFSPVNISGLQRSLKECPRLLDFELLCFDGSWFLIVSDTEG